MGQKRCEVTSLPFLALLVVLKASGKLLVDGEIDGFIVRNSIFVKELCTLGWWFFGRRNGLVLHFTRHVGDGWFWKEGEADSDIRICQGLETKIGCKTQVKVRALPSAISRRSAFET